METSNNFNELFKLFTKTLGDIVLNVVTLFKRTPKKISRDYTCLKNNCDSSINAS